jgi:hypothetical protein
MKVGGRDVKYKQNFVRNLKVRDHLRDLSVNGRTKLKYTEKMQDTRRTGWIHLVQVWHNADILDMS